MMNILQQDIQYLPGVGPNRKKMFCEELGISTIGDLLQYYPYRYVDRSRLYSISELNGEMPFVQVCGYILSFETFKMSARKERVVAHFTDGSGKVMDLVWFVYGKSALTKYKVNTIRQIVSRWAPETENATRIYINFVSSHSGIDADKPIQWSDVNSIVRIVRALCVFESNFLPQPALVQEAMLEV